jgi:hypothetical protein
MWDARSTVSSGDTQTTYDLDDWRQVRWVLTAVNWKPNNAIVPGRKGAVVLLFVKAEDDAEAIQQARQWAKQCGGQTAGVIETGLCVEGLPVSKRTLKSYDLIAQAAATCEPAFLIVASSNRKVGTVGDCGFVSSLAEAVSFLRCYRLPVDPLSEAETVALRARWRQRFLPPRIPPRRRHRCCGCGSRFVAGFDWDSLQRTEPLPPLHQLLKDDKEPIALFFETCDLPAFVCQAQVLRDFEPETVDLYLTPLKDCRWTVVYTHEQPLCGPYFCRSEAKVH